MSNGVAWYCPDVVSLGRVYVGGELADETSRSKRCRRCPSR